MASIRLKLKDGDQEAEVELEGNPVNYSTAVSILCSLLGKKHTTQMMIATTQTAKEPKKTIR